MTDLAASAPNGNRQPDLFSYTPPGKYPDTPGYKEKTTSRLAALKIAPHAKTLRAIALKEFRAAGPRGLTADEAAALVGEPPISFRPRVSDLRVGGFIEPTTETRTNASSGHTARVWRITALGMEKCEHE